MSLLNDLISQYGPSLTKQLTNQLGIDESKAAQALTAVGPLVVNGLKKQKDAGGSTMINDLMSQMGVSEDVLGQVEETNSLNAAQPQAIGENALAQLLGGQSNLGSAQNALSQSLGLDSGKAGQLLSTLTPVVMGFLMKKGRQDSQTPDTLSGIASILDRDGDGNALDDIAGMLLGNSGQQQGGNGLIGSLLGNVFGGKK